jgi:ribonuclease BN (tRNA processing enzyme)
MHVGALMRFFAPFVMCGAMILATPSAALAQGCATGSATVQILGSGGPALNPERASAGYLLWIGGQARMLVDMGGGAYLRFGQSGAKTSDLALVAISHLHPDHVSDLPALLWLSHTVRTEPLPIVGPSAGKGAAGPTGNDLAPDFQTFLSRLFDEKSGAFQVLGGALGGKGNGVRLDVSTVDVLKAEPTTVFEGRGLKVTALAIPHANMPTLAYRVETPDGSVVFSSDQNGTDPKFVDFARDADTLIMHMQVPAGTANNPLHAAPAVVGRLAQNARVRRLIVSHIGLAGPVLEAAIADLKAAYTGPLTVGADLQCTPIRG